MKHKSDSESSFESEMRQFLTSFSGIVDISKDMNLSLDDLYYVEYCKVKTNSLIQAIENEVGNSKDSKVELLNYKDTLNSILLEIELIEKAVQINGVSKTSKIDKKISDYKHSVRKAGNIIYSQAFETIVKDTPKTVYNIIDYVSLTTILGISAFYCNWTSIKSVTGTFAVGLLAQLGLVAFSGLVLSVLYGNKRLSKGYKLKQKYCSDVMYKIITQLDKVEYVYLANDLRAKRFSKDTAVTMSYILASVEELGEYVNKNNRVVLDLDAKDFDTLEEYHKERNKLKLRFDKQIENRLINIHSLLREG